MAGDEVKKGRNSKKLPFLHARSHPLAFNSDSNSPLIKVYSELTLIKCLLCRTLLRSQKSPYMMFSGCEHVVSLDLQN